MGLGPVGGGLGPRVWQPAPSLAMGAGRPNEPVPRRSGRHMGRLSRDSPDRWDTAGGWRPIHSRVEP